MEFVLCLGNKIRMKRIFILLGICILFLLSSFTGAHKFYVSVTNVAYSEEEASLQIISRIFIDDLEKLRDALQAQIDDIDEMIKDAKKLAREGKTDEAVKLARKAQMQGEDALAQYQSEHQRYQQNH